MGYPKFVLCPGSKHIGSVSGADIETDMPTEKPENCRMRTPVYPAKIYLGSLSNDAIKVPKGTHS